MKTHSSRERPRAIHRRGGARGAIRVLSVALVLAVSSCGPASRGGEISLMSVSPRSGPATGGTAITITGHGWDPRDDLEVWIGEKRATNVVAVSETTITATTPHSTVGFGPADVSVHRGSWGWAAWPADLDVIRGAFTYTP